MDHTRSDSLRPAIIAALVWFVTTCLAMGAYVAAIYWGPI